MHKILLVITLMFSFNTVKSHHKIYSPQVEEGRQSFEWRGHTDVDDRESKSKAHHHVLETEYSWTNFWQSELEFHISDKEDTPMDWEKTEFQNQLQIFDFENWAGALYFSYNFVSESEEADEIEYKYLNEFFNESFGLISNFIFEKQVGQTAQGSTTFSTSNYIFLKNIYNFNIGILGFSDFGYISDTSVFNKQKHQYGLQLETELDYTDKEFEIAIGYLHGLTDYTANHTFIWNLELEFN